MQRLIDLHNQIRAILLEYFDQQQIAYNLDKFKAATPAQIEHAVKWMTAFIEVRIERIQEVKLLVPEKMWEGYRNLGVTRGPYEVEMLRFAIKDMKREWASRPALLKKAGPIHLTDPNKKETRHGKQKRHPKGPKRVRVQSAEPRTNGSDR